MKLLSPVDLKDGLVEDTIAAMQNRIKTRADGEAIAPNLYTLNVHPIRANCCRRSPGCWKALPKPSYATGAEEGFVFLRPPVLRLAEDRSCLPMRSGWRRR